MNDKVNNVNQIIITMNEVLLRGLRILVYSVCLAVLIVPGNYFLLTYLDQVGGYIGIAIVVAAYMLPFALSDERHPFDKNLKISIYATALVYGFFAISYLLGFIINTAFCINTVGVVTCLLGLAGLIFIDAISLLSLMLIAKILKTRNC